MVLEGVVTNVAAFGAFVDIGVHQDGLVHVSAMSKTFVKDPRSEVAKPGDVVLREGDGGRRAAQTHFAHHAARRSAGRGRQAAGRHPKGQAAPKKMSAAPKGPAGAKAGGGGAFADAFRRAGLNGNK